MVPVLFNKAETSSSDSLITSRSNLLIWQCTPSKPGWHLHMYSLKTSPRLVGAMTSHDPSLLQGLGLQGPEREGEGEAGGGQRVPLTRAPPPNVSSLLYLFPSGCRCLLRSRLRRYRWMARLQLRSRTFLHYGRDSPHNSPLWKRDEMQLTLLQCR